MVWLTLGSRTAKERNNVPSMTAHWRNLANTIELLFPSAHWSPQPKW